MKGDSNPLKKHFGIAIFLLFCASFDFVLRIAGNNSLFTSGWELMQKIVGLGGLGTFLYFYAHKSLLAWHTLVILYTAMLPFVFLVQLPENPILTKTKLILLIALFWVYLIAGLLMNFRKYSTYIDQFEVCDNNDFDV